MRMMSVQLSPLYRFMSELLDETFLILATTFKILKFHSFEPQYLSSSADGQWSSFHNAWLGLLRRGIHPQYSSGFFPFRSDSRYAKFFFVLRFIDEVTVVLARINSLSG